MEQCHSSFLFLGGVWERNILTWVNSKSITANFCSKDVRGTVTYRENAGKKEEPRLLSTYINSFSQIQMKL